MSESVDAPLSPRVGSIEGPGMLLGRAESEEEGLLREGGGSATANFEFEQGDRVLDRAASATSIEFGDKSIGRKRSSAAKVHELVYVCRSIKLQLFGLMIYSFIAVSKGVTFFPFIRTTIECDSTIEATLPANPLWSGSAHCTDLDIVAREAQLLKGVSEGLDQGAHCLLLPALGHAIDCFGRRWGVMVGMIGVFFQCLLYLFASVIGAGPAAHAMVTAGSVVQGLTGVFITAVQASVRDIQTIDDADDTPHESHAFGIMQGAQGLSNAFGLFIVASCIIAKNLVSYDVVWIIYAVIAGLSAGILYCTFPETLVNRTSWNWRKANPISVLDMIVEHNAYRWTAFTLFFSVLAVSSLTVLQAYTIAEYKWTQTYSTVIFTVLSPFALVSLVFSFRLIPKLGPYNVVKIGFLFYNVGTVVLCFARFGPIFVFIGLACFFLCVGVIPAVLQILTSLPSDYGTGQVLGNTGSVSLAAIAIGNVLFGVIFRSVGEIKDLSFFIALPLTIISTICARRANYYAQILLNMEDSMQIDDL
eukprot:CAMPEP_0203764344 /NCGR_PEP_ID=MMETSP0098-20131031/17626_1 /ASSEMBLY_ACC=CAM_ASM_000208 /TAXON_ID=96639 /ORGANISM=" , Strain NY0313808BC1" /LENGTH=531 /DNA_ID=CAMNT_0050660171 /DNA_START=192 /DNA_END=1787 /DNA_ORIENTATION=+